MIAPLIDKHLELIEPIVSASQSPQFHWTLPEIAYELRQHKGYGLFDHQGLHAFAVTGETASAVELSVLASHPQFRRQGAMQRLLKFIFAMAKPLPVWLEVHEHNHGAICLYRQLGMREVGRRPAYYSDQQAALLFSFSD